MADPRLRQVRELFDRALEQSTESRSAFLDEECVDDPELREEVASLLAADAADDSPIDQPFFDLHPEPATLPAGQRVGAYRIVRELGRGGLGVVYLAERVEFEQRVALKVIKRGMDTDEVVRRFHRERQILANLEHPHIARLLDGGSTRDGRPYFVMELVDGERLDAYCQAHELSTPERLRLFLQVCSAVEFAHRNLIVHRDLKPSNILVTRAGPKLLDFGIATLLRPDDAPPTRLTVAGSSPMTPDYASPEQIRGDAVTTASDVYSLGVIFHQLITGALPADDPARFPHRDLACIADKALRPEPEQRYGSVEQLAADVRRHLDGLPVLARDGAWLYRASKFLRRHRGWLAATAIVGLMIVAGLAQRQESARRVAEAELARRLAAERADEAHRQSEIRSELLLNLFSASDRGRDESLTVEELLTRAEERIRGNLDGEPLATQLEILGRLYGDLADREPSRRLLEEVLRRRRELYAGDHPLVARVLNNLAAWHFDAGELERAEQLYQESLEMRRRLGQDDVDQVKAMSNLASILTTRGDFDRAEELYRQVLAIRRQAQGTEHPAVATTLRGLGTVLYLRGDAEAAEPLLREALEIRRQHFGSRDARVAAAEISLGRALQSLGRFDEAVKLLESAFATRRELFGDDHPHVALARKDLAALILDRTEPLSPAAVAGAEALLTRALEVFREWKPEGSWEVADSESLLGACRMGQGRFEEAETHLRAGYLSLQELRGAEAIYTRNAYRRLVELYAAWGRPLPDGLQAR